MTHVHAQLIDAGRALTRAALVHAYGHCSIRAGDGFVVTPPRPIGLLSEDDEFPFVGLGGPLPVGVAGEVRIHRAVYCYRSDVGAICRFQSRAVMALSVFDRTPRPRHGFGAYFAPGVPLWRDPQLVRDDERADAVASLLGAASAIVLRGNGAVTVAETIERAVTLAWYLEDAARLELEVLRMAGSGAEATELSDAEAAHRATWDGQIAERMWEHLTADPDDRV